MILQRFVVLTWMRDTIEFMFHVTLWNSNSFSSHIYGCGPLHFTWPSQAMCRTHAPTFKKKKKMTLHILTHGAMRECGLTSLMACINDNICDVREKNVTNRSEIWTTNIRSLGFHDTREWVILWKLTLRSLGCTHKSGQNFFLIYFFLFFLFAPLVTIRE